MGFTTAEPASHRGLTDVWLTPLWIIERLGPFDLDPCGEITWPTAENIYTEQGLEKEWKGRIWLNPPYSELVPWLEKLYQHNHGVALVFARTETKWAQKYFQLASSVFFPARRIKFLRKNTESAPGPNSPSMFLSFGERTDWKMDGWIAK